MLVTLLVIPNGNEHFEVHSRIQVISWQVFWYQVVCIQTSMRLTGNENTSYEITRILECALWCTFSIWNTSIILTACPIFAGWDFIQRNCYAELSSISEGSYSIENACISWNLFFRAESHPLGKSMVGCISKFYFLYVFYPEYDFVRIRAHATSQCAKTCSKSFDPCSNIFLTLNRFLHTGGTKLTYFGQLQFVAIISPILL